MNLVEIAPELLVEDMEFYPRSHVDGSWVNDLARTIKAGGELPPPVVDKKSKRIIDGFHRVRASIKAGLEVISVDMRGYRSRARMLEDAVALNANHGLKLNSRDRVRVVLMLEKEGLSQKRIANSLHTTEDRVVKLRERVVEVNGEGPIPAKPAYWTGKDEPPLKVTRAQVDQIESAPGWRHRQTVKWLTGDLRQGLVDLNDDALVAALTDLKEALDEAL